MRRASGWRRGRHFWYRLMLRSNRRGGSQSRWGTSRLQSGTSDETSAELSDASSDEFRAPAVTRRRLSAKAWSGNTFVKRHALDKRAAHLDQRLLHQIVAEAGEPEGQADVHREVLQAPQ